MNIKLILVKDGKNCIDKSINLIKIIIKTNEKYGFIKMDIFNRILIKVYIV